MTSLSVGCHNDNAEKADGLPDTYGDPTLSTRSSTGGAQSSPDRAEGRIEKLGTPILGSPVIDPSHKRDRPPFF